jgi:hypothetical protein
MDKVNKWKAIEVVKAVRVVMRFPSAMALGVVLTIAAPVVVPIAVPVLMQRDGEPHAQHETKSLDEQIGRAATEAVVSVVDSLPPDVVDGSYIRKPRKDVRNYS